MNSKEHKEKAEKLLSDVTMLLETLGGQSVTQAQAEFFRSSIEISTRIAHVHALLAQIPDRGPVDMEFLAALQGLKLDLEEGHDDKH